MIMDSLWLATSPRRSFPPLDGDAEFDVVVIGGGITGLTAAALLAAAGRRGAAVEMRRIGLGESGRTTAHLTEVVDVSYRRLRRSMGVKRARRIAESTRASIDQIERMVGNHAIPCAFERVPAWIYADREEDVAELRA